MADYRAHQLDTRILHSNDDGELECHVFCDIVADVSFEQNVQDWVIRGQGVIPAAFPTVVYKVRIIRS